MACGDLNDAEVLQIWSGDTALVDLQSGAGSPGVVRWRDGDIDLQEPSGPDQWLAQGHIVRLQDWLAPLDRLVEIVQYGTDQYGRLVGLMRPRGGGDPWSVVARDEGRGTYVSHDCTGGPFETRWDPRYPGLGFPDQLRVDTSVPLA